MEFVGKSVSIHCIDELGVFQGTIRSADAERLTIVRAFRNGLPVRTLDTEITIQASDIINLQLIASAADGGSVGIGNVSAGQQSNGGGHNNHSYQQSAQSVNYQQTANAPKNNGPEMVAMLMNNIRNGVLTAGGPGHGSSQNRSPCTTSINPQQQPRHGVQQRSTPHQKISYHPNNVANNSTSATTTVPNNPHLHVQKHFANLIPSKVEVRLGSVNVGNSASSAAVPSTSGARPKQQQHMPQNNNNSHQQPPAASQRISSNNKTVAYTQNSAFEANADDPRVLAEDFDFEKNLALFDKTAIWTEIDALQQPEMMRQTSMVRPKNYRYDENILPSMPAASSRQIVGGAANNGTRQSSGASQARTISNGASLAEFTTDDGLVIPTVPRAQRDAVLTAAQAAGMAWTRQYDMLARGCAELALQLLGGARRLTPQNRHQWPTVVVLCDLDIPWTDSQTETGLAAGRHLASHGLKVCVYGGPRGGGAGPDEMSGSGITELALFEACGSSVWRTTVVNDLPSCDLVIVAVKSFLTPKIVQWINDSRSPTLAIDPPVIKCGTGQSRRAGAGGAAGGSRPPVVSMVTTIGVAIKHSILPVLPVHGIGAATSDGKLYLCNLGIPDRFYAEAGIQYRSPFGHKFVIPIHPLTADEQRAGGGGGAAEDAATLSAASV